jgi:FKBP-type peptidyl-prolyl cis-trans isomerase 2
MSQVKYGDEVKVHYTCRLEDGEVLDSTMDSDPVQLKIGEGGTIPGFEQALIGMNPGELKTTEIPAKEAYGPYKKELVVEVDRNRLPTNLDPKIGQKLEIKQANGQKILVSVAKISDLSIILDANHPLAGKDLIFDINLVEII